MPASLKDNQNMYVDIGTALRPTQLQQCESGDENALPPAGHWVYEWPVDLFAPDIVILLTVNEGTRGKRMSSRKDKETVEEKRLAESVNFRKRYVFLADLNGV